MILIKQNGTTTEKLNLCLSLKVTWFSLRKISETGLLSNVLLMVSGEESVTKSKVTIPLVLFH